MMTTAGPTRPRRVPLSANEVHVWLAFPEQLREPSLLAAYARLMTPEEHAKRERYRFDKQKQEQLVTRALVRTTLSRYTDVAPSAWVFTANKYGRPAIAAGQCALPLVFNLSHTDGLIACAVTLNREVGVDVELINRRVEALALAESHFSEREARDLRAIPEEERQQRFFTYWTLKEAYIKARGMGLAIPLRDFGFVLEKDDRIGISFAPALEDDASTWHFSVHRPTETHVLAVAARETQGLKLQIRVQETRPLED